MTIDKSINFLLYLRNRVHRLDNLKLYTVFGSGFIIDHALNVLLIKHIPRCHRKLDGKEQKKLKEM